MENKNPYISAEARQAAQVLDEQAQRFNTQVAKGSDLDYFWGWASIVHHEREHYPVNWGLVFDFAATHLTGNFNPEHETALIKAGLKQGKGRHRPARYNAGFRRCAKNTRTKAMPATATPAAIPRF